jgi:hypothetical protein
MFAAGQSSAPQPPDIIHKVLPPDSTEGRLRMRNRRGDAGSVPERAFDRVCGFGGAQGLFRST